MHRREHWWMAEAMRWRMETNFVINSTHSAGMQRARHTDKFKKWRRKNKELGRRRHDWRMDGSRSERETEKRERRNEEKVTAKVQMCLSYLTILAVCVCICFLLVCVCVCVHSHMFSVCVCHCDWQLPASSLLQSQRLHNKQNRV